MADAVKANKYAKWLVNNQNKKGTKDFETVKQAYLEVRPSTAGEKSEAVGRGLNVGVANFLGAPIDLANQSPRLLNLLPNIFAENYPFSDPRTEPQNFSAISDNPIGGSQSLRNLMSTVGLGYTDITNLPKSQRPFAVGGETFGQAAGLFAPVLGLASRAKGVDAATKAVPSGNVLSDLLSSITSTIARNPKTAIAAETALAVPPSIGAGIAEQVRPGDQTARLYGELAGAFSPIAVTQALSSVTQGLQRATQSLSKGGRERAAAKIAQEQVTQRGGDPDFLARVLRQSTSPATPGQITGNEGLLALENELVRQSSTVNKAVETRTQAAISDFNKAYRTAIASGDPELIRQASQARIDFVTGSLAGRVNQAEENAKNIFNANIPTTDKNAANVAARKILEDELNIARKTENDLWQRVDKNITVKSDSTLAAFKEVKDGLASGETLPAPIPAVIKDIRKKQPKKQLGRGETTSGNLLRTRSRYLELARDARAAKKFGDARMFQKLADGMLDDLRTVGGIAADEARAFSRELNEKFKQGFVGDVLRLRSDGGFAIDPQRTLEVANTGSDVQTRLNLEAMQGVQRSADTGMIDAQQDFFTALARETTTFDGTVDPAKLENFIQRNAQSLQSLGLKDEFSNTAIATRAAQNAAKRAEQGTKFAQSKSTAAQILNTNNVEDFATNILTSNNIKDGLVGAVRLAKRSGDSAVLDGLRYGIYDALLKLSTTNGKLISGSRLNAILTKKTGGSTVEKTLLSSGLMTKSQITNVKTIARKTAEFEKALINSDRAEDILGGEDVFYDLLLRIGGANLGGMSVLGQSAGAPIVVAGAGSRAARRVLDQVPQGKIRGVLEAAIDDRQLMATLLQKPTSAKAKAAQSQRLYAILTQAGLIEGSEMLSEIGVQ